MADGRLERLALDHGRKGVRDQRVELGAGLVSQFLHRLGHRQRRAVGARRRHRVEAVGDDQHVRLDRDVALGDGVWEGASMGVGVDVPPGQPPL